MSLSGKLEDVSLADVLQFIHLGGKSGVLELSTDDQQAQICFYQGRIINAAGPKTKNIGDLLTDSGAITPASLQQAVETQKKQMPREPLGRILVGMGAITTEQLHRLVGAQIEQTIYQLVTWTRGSFHFALDDVRPIDDLALSAAEIVPLLQLNTQMLLLEAMRIFDERSRAKPPLKAVSAPANGAAKSRPTAGVPPPPKARPARMLAPSPQPRAGSGRQEIQVVTGDDALAQSLKEALAPIHVCRRVELADAGSASDAQIAPFVLLDLRLGTITSECISALRRARPLAHVIAVSNRAVPLSQLYAAGAVAVLPATTKTIAACIQSLSSHIGNLTQQLPAARANPDGFASLRRTFSDLRSGLLVTTVSLSLLTVVSQMVERAVLFVVRRSELAVIGAFGQSSSGKPLAELTRAFAVDRQAAGAFSTCLQTGQPCSVEVSESALPKAFVQRVGRPAFGRCVILPLLGSERPIALVYVDNGSKSEPVEETEILELTTAQVGSALESELVEQKKLLSEA